MSGVSDLPFRRAASRLGAPYVATEMVACETLAKGRADVVRRAARGKDIALTVIQLVGRETEWLARGARIAEESRRRHHRHQHGLPCQARSDRRIAGSALMRDLDRAERADRGGGSAPRSVPVTPQDAAGLGRCLEERGCARCAGRKRRRAAITVHGRTRQQFFEGVADWRAVAEVEGGVALPVIVNGDIVDAASAREALAAIGRGRGDDRTGGAVAVPGSRARLRPRWRTAARWQSPISKRGSISSSSISATRWAFYGDAWA